MLFLKQGTKKFFIKKSLLLKKVRVKMTLNLTRNILFVIMLFSPIISLPVLTDVAEPWQLGFQDPATPTMEGIIEFHNNLMFFITLIAIFTTWVIVRCISFYSWDQSEFNDELQKNDGASKPVDREVAMFTHSTPLEIIWTIVPAIILLFIAIPSFALLYSMDEMIDPALTLKVVGHQWYWSYEFSDYATLEGGESLNFDSYMLSLDDLTLGNLRLLEVDNRVILPVNTHIRVIVTAADVLHSWAIPSFGLKVDACPGRLNQTSLFIKREGTFYGQCSEICGVNHGFMPIVVKTVDLESYVSWIASKLEDLELA
jgi:cytochrome c oxidase subunit 2|tara:strand:- start:1419 stop:2360 length:942 start_codon:yes stop_codon:yes gene_type:complete